MSNKRLREETEGVVDEPIEQKRQCRENLLAEAKMLVRKLPLYKSFHEQHIDLDHVTSVEQLAEHLLTYPTLKADVVLGEYLHGLMEDEETTPTDGEGKEERRMRKVLTDEEDDDEVYEEKVNAARTLGRRRATGFEYVVSHYSLHTIAPFNALGIKHNKAAYDKLCDLAPRTQEEELGDAIAQNAETVCDFVRVVNSGVDSAGDLAGDLVAATFCLGAMAACDFEGSLAVRAFVAATNFVLNP